MNYVSGSDSDQKAASLRERLLLDFGRRFKMGHATDPAKDLGFGEGSFGAFAKSGNILRAARVNYNDSDGKQVNVPHDWAIELPFQNDCEQGLASTRQGISSHQRGLVSTYLRPRRA